MHSRHMSLKDLRIFVFGVHDPVLLDKLHLWTTLKECSIETTDQLDAALKGHLSYLPPSYALEVLEGESCWVPITAGWRAAPSSTLYIRLIPTQPGGPPGSLVAAHLELMQSLHRLLHQSVFPSPSSPPTLPPSAPLPQPNLPRVASSPNPAPMQQPSNSNQAPLTSPTSNQIPLPNSSPNLPNSNLSQHITNTSTHLTNTSSQLAMPTTINQLALPPTNITLNLPIGSPMLSPQVNSNNPILQWAAMASAAVPNSAATQALMTFAEAMRAQHGTGLVGGTDPEFSHKVWQGVVSLNGKYLDDGSQPEYQLFEGVIEAQTPMNVIWPPRLLIGKLTAAVPMLMKLFENMGGRTGPSVQPFNLRITNRMPVLSGLMQSMRERNTVAIVQLDQQIMLMFAKGGDAFSVLIMPRSYGLPASGPANSNQSRIPTPNPTPPPLPPPLPQSQAPNIGSSLAMMPTLPQLVNMAAHMAQLGIPPQLQQPLTAGNQQAQSQQGMENGGGMHHIPMSTGMT